MNFTAKQLNQYETVAEILSATRQEKGIELTKIEKTLKINKKYLQALENGKYEILPSAIYVKNFAKTYAAYLGLDVKKIAELVERELGIINQLNNPNQRAPQPQTLKNKILITPKLIRNSLIIILALACLIYLGWQINAIFSPPPLEIISPTPELATDQNLITLEGQTLPETEITINNQEILADQNGHFIKSLDLQTGLNTIEIRAKKKHSKANVVIRRVMLEIPPIIIEGAAPMTTPTN
jgi:cytoskeletal protein RodZ